MTEESGIHWINLPAVAYAFDPKNLTGWVLARLSPTGMRLEARGLDKSHADHGKVSELKWRAG